MNDKHPRRQPARNKAWKTGKQAGTPPPGQAEPMAMPTAVEAQAIHPSEASPADQPAGTEVRKQANKPGPPAADAEAEPLMPTKALNNPRTWKCMYEAVVGLSHRNANPPLPCQDAAFARSQPRPSLIVADGAGSAAMAEVGAQAVVSATARLLNTLDKQVACLLDGPVTAQELDRHSLQARNFALLLVKHAKGVLEDLAEQHRRPLRDFRCTLLLIVIGEMQALWLKLGDGALVYERLSGQANGAWQTEMNTLGAPGKGEFANTTQFIDDQLSPDDVQSGLLPLENITGFAAMSDGAAEKLIAHDGSRVARQLEHWLQALRQGRLARRDLTRSFYSEAFCSGSTGDDCSITMLASELQPPR